jgi:hypothetical protein
MRDFERFTEAQPDHLPGHADHLILCYNANDGRGRNPSSAACGNTVSGKAIGRP